MSKLRKIRVESPQMAAMIPPLPVRATCCSFRQKMEFVSPQISTGLVTCFKQ